MNKRLWTLVVALVALLGVVPVAAQDGWTDVRCANGAQNLYTQASGGMYYDSGLRIKSGLIFQVPAVYGGQYVLMRWTDGASGTVGGLYIDNFKCALRVSFPSISSNGSKAVVYQPADVHAEIAPQPTAALGFNYEFALTMLMYVVVIVVLIIKEFADRDTRQHLKDALSSDAAQTILGGAFNVMLQVVSKTSTDIDNKALGSVIEALRGAGWQPSSGGGLLDADRE